MRALDEVDRVGDSGMGRNPLQVAELINSHAEGDADLDIELLAAAGIVLDEEIELRAISQCAEDDLGGEPGVARVDSGGMGEKEIGRPGACLLYTSRCV